MQLMCMTIIYSGCLRAAMHMSQPIELAISYLHCMGVVVIVGAVDIDGTTCEPYASMLYSANFTMIMITYAESCWYC